MKSKMNPRKRYANGTSNIGANYIESPAEVLNDYNIQMAKVEAKALSNPWLPVVGAIGGAAVGFATKGLNATIKQPGEAANGMNNVQADVEVEGGEMYETPQGQVGEFQGPSHEQGGIPLEVGQDVQEGTKVYSDRLKVGKKTLAERKATREKQVANLEKIASNNLADQAVKNAAKRKMMAIEREEAADLDFQDKVNNMQAMADTMVAAFGTSMEGIQDNPIGDSMRYGYGSSASGVQKYAGGGIIDPITQRAYENWASASLQDLQKKYPGNTPLLERPEVKKDFQTFLFRDKAGTKDADNDYSIDADFGKTTNTFAKKYDDIYNQIKATDSEVGYFGMAKDKKDIAENNYKNPPMVTKGTEMDLAKNQPNLFPQANLFINNNMSTTGLDPNATVEGEKEPSKFSKVLSKLGENSPGLGDLTKMVGNYLGMTAGIKTAAEQRSTDITHTNVYKNAGKESQKLLDNAKQGIETSKAQAIVKATDVSRGGKRGGRNSARGVNQMRAMDWLYDSALQQQVADISAKAAEQISGIDVQKSSVAMNADQLKGQGEYQAAMANEAAKDAYYTALGQGRKDFATGLQQTGKDLNAMKENKIIENLMKNYGKWVGASNTGELMNKAGITQDSKTKQYKDASGKILTEEEVQAALLKVNK